MTLKRIHVGFSASQLKVLDRLAQRLGLDKTNTIRYCIARIAEQEFGARDRGAGNQK